MWQGLLVSSPKVVIGGLRVVMSPNAGLNVLLSTRLALALELIDHYDPRLGRRLRRDVKGIWFIPAGGTHWNTRFKAIALDVRREAPGTVETLALTLAHEATHARHHALGVRYRGKEPRAESACIRATIALADRLGPYVRRPSLDALDDPWWTREKRVPEITEAMKILGAPAFVSRMVNRKTT